MDCYSGPLFQEICTQNGVECGNEDQNYGEFCVLYALFSGISDLPWLEKFVNLTELVIISQPVRRIVNMKGCRNLRKLWICECEIFKIENIECLKLLEELYLYGNNITKIENLENLLKISVLWLNENWINSMDGLSNLVNLKILNVSDNRIRNLGNFLENNVKLTDLYISGNIIEDFKEIVHLSQLPLLSSLSINECGFKQNPICTNPNLPLLLMHYLPKLKVLDNVNLDLPELRQAVRAVMNAKQGFYATGAQCVLSVRDVRQKLLKDRYRAVETKVLTQIHLLDKAMKSLQTRRGLKGKVEQSIEIGESAQVTQYINEIQTRITFWEYMIEKYQEELNFASCILAQHTDLKYNLLQLELDLCGYFEFIQGTTNDEWFHRCSELIASRFCIHHLYAISISGIRIHNVYKVNNKLLNQKFYGHEKHRTEPEELAAKPEENNIPNASDCGQEYLLLVCPRNQDKTKYFPELLKSGIKLPIQGAVLSNSLSLADEENLGDLLKSCSRNKYWTPARFATILLLRALTAFGTDFKTMTESDQCNSGTKLSNKFKCAENGCSCKVVNKSFSFYEENCLLPEFIVELEYLTKHEVTSPFYQILVSPNPKLDFPMLEEDIRMDSVLLKKLPSRLFRPNIAEVSDSTLDLFYDSKTHGSTENPSLTITDFKCPRNLNLQRFKDLTQLRLTHCNLQKIPTFVGTNLLFIDFSFNRLSSLKSIPVSQKLLSFDVRHNALSNALEDLEALQASFQKLREIKWRFNPWKRPENVRFLAAAMLPEIKNIDNQEVTDDERAEGRRMMLHSKIDAGLILNENLATSIPVKEYCFLSIGSVAKYISTWTKLSCRTAKRNSWSSITSLCLHGCNIQTLENIERLTSVRYINLDCNHLKSLKGISQCTNLEEVSAESNFISTIDDLERLKRLRRLLLGNNLIKSLSSIKEGDFQSLQIMSLRSNSIFRLSGIHLCKGLRELYIGNNQISELKSILQIKTLTHLAVIDLNGNPITQKLENYRLRIIHHLRSLKSLDGSEIRTAEIAQSRELLGGHLSHELLMEKLETDQFSNITQMDMPNMGLKIVDYLSPDSFRRLQSVNLEKNQLTSFGGLLFLPELRVLCLNENSIESLFPKNIQILAESTQCKPNDSIDLQYLALYKSTQAIFPYLQVVHLAKNQISSLAPFHFHRMPALRSLFLQHNEIVNVTGLEGLHQLRELVLDGNRIKEVGEVSFFYNWSLQEIHLENNRLKDLQSLCRVESLKRLFVGGNRLCNLGDLENFALAQKNLIEISLVDNPLTAKQLHRLILVHGSPRITSIDGISVTAEERERANAFYAEQELQNVVNGSILPVTSPPGTKLASLSTDIALPGINTHKTALLTSRMPPNSQCPLTCAQQVRPSYSIVNIGCTLDSADSSNCPNRPTKQNNAHCRLARPETYGVPSAVSESENHNLNANVIPKFHSAASQNMPGMSIKPVNTGKEQYKSPQSDNHLVSADRFWRLSTTYGADR
ncbi:Leucine-rich repeat-containing protein 9 [Fasciolopsis buskii]|uniref:Leucine-rich repeat-containing protein 9 n=1 Tax=Fasciolopsis buskii TaxID=27845 RepID=A0A8E0RRN4_9TREM|nr:Leucine-rich repeat-containing protein 9 [Fasciolopsis buski]